MLRFTLVSLLLAFTLGCASPRQPLPVPAPVDLQRFMGDWYVIGFIPLFPERNAHNGIESYQLSDDGRIAVSYQFREGGFAGPLKTYHPQARVVDNTGNTEWRTQFIWPFTADYRIAYVSPDYSETIIARQARDYVWLMARTPVIADDRLQALRQQIADMGYDMSAFRLQPQQWPESSPR